jgi:hypothetical protein
MGELVGSVKQVKTMNETRGFEGLVYSLPLRTTWLFITDQVRDIEGKA